MVMIPVWKPGMRGFPLGIHPFHPTARLVTYRAARHVCSYEDPGRAYRSCGMNSVTGALDATGTTWNRCANHAGLDSNGGEAVAVVIAWPVPAQAAEGRATT